MIRLAMALSVFCGKMDEIECRTEEFFDGKTQVWSSKYISQMEPVVFYLLENYDDDLEVIMLCSKETHSLIDGVGKDSIEFFEERVIAKAKALNKKAVMFRQVLLDKDNPIPGIIETALHVKKGSMLSGEEDKIWLDLHGGFRDISVTFNAIITLLKVYGIRTDKVVTVQWIAGKPSIIKDVTNTFRIFDFVSGMNEFVQYGSAETLLGFENDFIDKDVLVGIKSISDGTKICDPYLYKKGLKELGSSLKKNKKLGHYTDLFVQYIRSDYGDLLETPSNIGIVKRCYKKKMYQQALTFIESLMPETFIENRVLFYNTKESDLLKTIQEEQELRNPKNYSLSHFVFDNYINKLDGYLKSPKAKGSLTKNEVVIEAIKNLKNLKTEFITDGDSLDITNKKRLLIGTVYVYTELKSEYVADAGRLIRLHTALKNCRNMTNHAQENQSLRPDIEDIDNALAYYIELAEIVFNPKNREEVGHNYKKSFLVNKEDSNNTYNKVKRGWIDRNTKTGGYSILGDALKSLGTVDKNIEPQSKLLDIGSVHRMTINKKGMNAKKKMRLEGVLENGEGAILPGNTFGEGDILDSYIGKEYEVLIDRIQDGKYICSLSEEK